jgi:hypothetical protein
MRILGTFKWAYIGLPGSGFQIRNPSSPDPLRAASLKITGLTSGRALCRLRPPGLRRP